MPLPLYAVSGRENDSEIRLERHDDRTWKDGMGRKTKDFSQTYCCLSSCNLEIAEL